MIGYKTALGSCLTGDSMDLADTLEDGSVDLVMTSPPFALLRQKAYGNRDQAEYADWLCGFGRKMFPKLKDTGSFVLDLGGAYNRGEPTYSLYQFRVLLQMCDSVGYRLAQPFYWHNPSALPAPIEWVNKRKLRAKNSVNTVWWLSKTENPKADVRNVLVPYSSRMEHLITHIDEFVPEEGTLRPSGHSMGKSSWKDNGGAIPSNMLQIPNSESNSQYLRSCKALGVKSHPARFPSALPEFFIKLTTDPGDLVVDIFAGSNTTGQAAQSLRRRWISFEMDQGYVAASSFRFTETPEDAVRVYGEILNGGFVEIQPYQTDLTSLLSPDQPDAAGQ